jgi:hypothetical protein
MRNPDIEVLVDGEANAIPRGPLQMLYYLTRLVVPKAVDQFNSQNVQYYEPPHLHCPNPAKCTDAQPTHMHFEIDPDTNTVKTDFAGDPIVVKDYTCAKHNKIAFEQYLSDIMMRKQVHQHSFTCRCAHVADFLLICWQYH